MQHMFDLSGDGVCRFQFFPDAVAAFAIPAALQETLSLLVWGVVLPQPEQDRDFCKRLPPAVQSALPSAVYLSGWGLLTLQGVKGGVVQVWPYEPTLELHDLQFPNSNDPAVPPLCRNWPVPPQAAGLQYAFSLFLEQPLSFLSLKMAAAGPVTLRVRPEDFVTEEQLNQHPERYRFDLTRTRQMQDVIGR